MTARQMTFDLAGAPRFGEEDFLVSASNESAYRAVAAWPDWASPWLLLIGPRGAGKSHLAAIWAARARARTISGETLEIADAPGLVGAPLLIEDADRIGGREAALFHLLNLAKESRLSVLLTAAAEPGAWGLTTPDLLSRLRLAPQVALETPDDALMRAALLKLFFDRQLSVDEGVIETLALHLDRSLDAARTVVAALDARSLAERRRITRGMAREAVQIAGLDWQQEFFADGAEDG